MDYCVAVSDAFGWRDHTNRQGAEMAFEEADTLLTSSGSNETLSAL